MDKGINMNNLHLLLLAILGISLTTPSWAILTKISEESLVDSEEPFSRRIYSYDFDVSKDGIVHAVYSQPVPGGNKAHIIYKSKPVGATWASQQRHILETEASIPSISTYLIYDDNTAIVHICYIVERDFVDQDGITHNGGLVYQTIQNGVIGPKINISSGGFYTKMQLDANGKAIFAREYEIFVAEDGTLLSPPFPKALRIQLPIADAENKWTDRDYVFRLPSPTAPAEDYRLATFLYDKQAGRYHLTYGDKNALVLRNTYPTTNPPLTAGKTPVAFPPGVGHKLWYAYSDDLKNWSTSIIDPSGDISENEFWTDFILDSNAIPYAANFRYKTDAKGMHQGSTNIIGKFINGAWKIQTVAGKSTGASASRAGMGSKLTIDAAGNFHAVWDNSPDTPIDGESGQIGAGTIMYRFSPDGQNWNVRQVVLPYSAEGQCKVKIFNNKYLLMVLGDARDTHLKFIEFQMPTPTEDLLEISSDKMFYGVGETINFNARLQGTGTNPKDLYLIAAGPYNAIGANLQAVSTTKFYYLGSDLATWNNVASFNQAQATVKNFPLINFNGNFLTAIARSTPPFNNPARYVLYSIVKNPGVPLTSSEESFKYILHLCNKPQCAELQ